MATYTLYDANDIGAWDDVDKVKCIRSRILGSAGYVTGDIIKALRIPAGTLALNVMTKVVTPQTSKADCTALTATIGDSTAADNWKAGVLTNLMAPAGTVLSGITAAETTRAIGGGFFYSAADYIKATLALTGGGATTDFVLDVMAIVVNF